MAGNKKNNHKMDTNEPVFVTSELENDVKIEEEQDGAVSESKVQSLIEGTTTSALLIGLVITSITGTIVGFGITTMAFFILLVTSVMFGLSKIDNKQLPYQWYPYGERSRVVRKEVDLEEADAECMECGHDVGIGVERQAQNELVMAGFTLRADKLGVTHNCASCSTYIDEEEEITESVNQTEETEESTETEQNTDENVEETEQSTDENKERNNTSIWSKNSYQNAFQRRNRNSNTSNSEPDEEEQVMSLWDELDEEIATKNDTDVVQSTTDDATEQDKSTNTPKNTERETEKEPELELA